jgi:hypothetical protein
MVMQIPKREAAVEKTNKFSFGNLSEMEDERIIAKLVQNVDLSYPKAVKDKSINLQTALALGVLSELINMAAKENMPIEKIPDLRLVDLMLRLISADMELHKGEILNKFLQKNSVYMPKKGVG